MSQELIYTSAPRGLLPGSQGFCTVAVTKSLSAAWREALERLSAFRPPFPPGDTRNPVRYSHLRLTIGGQTRSVLSRVSDAGLDYSGRSNILAHHVVVAPDDQCAAGPAWLLQQPDTFPEWHGEIGWLNERRLPDGDRPPRPCRRWEELTGDAGWGGALVEALATGRPADLIAPPDDVLGLFVESLALVEPSRRWSVGLATLAIDSPAASVAWQGHLPGPGVAEKLRRRGHGIVIEGRPSCGRAENGSASSARKGQVAPAANADSLSRTDDALTLVEDPTFVAEEPQSAATQRHRPVARPLPPRRYQPSHGNIAAIIVCCVGVVFLLCVGAVTLLLTSSARTDGDSKTDQTAAAKPSAEVKSAPAPANAKPVDKNEPKQAPGEPKANEPKNGKSQAPDKSETKKGEKNDKATGEDTANGSSGPPSKSQIVKPVTVLRRPLRPLLSLTSPDSFPANSHKPIEVIALAEFDIREAVTLDVTFLVNDHPDLEVSSKSPNSVSLAVRKDQNKKATSENLADRYKFEARNGSVWLDILSVEGIKDDALKASFRDLLTCAIVIECNGNRRAVVLSEEIRQSVAALKRTKQSDKLSKWEMLYRPDKGWPFDVRRIVLSEAVVMGMPTKQSSSSNKAPEPIMEVIGANGSTGEGDKKEKTKDGTRPTITNEATTTLSSTTFKPCTLSIQRGENMSMMYLTVSKPPQGFELKFLELKVEIEPGLRIRAVTIGERPPILTYLELLMKIEPSLRCLAAAIVEKLSILRR